VELIRPSTWRRLGENPQLWILGACVVVLACLIGRELWMTVRAFAYSPAQSAPASVVAGEQGDFAERIAAAGLFGNAPKQASGAPLQSDLQLTLRGVFTASDSRNASAMLESPDGRVQIIKVGAGLAPDTTLQQVFSNHIVVLRNGVQESLYFPTPQAGDAAPVAASADADIGSPVASSADTPAAGASPEELKRAAILRRLEELRARSSQ
jgi:type II secretory pathway component PulC